MRRLDCSEAEELIVRHLDEGLDPERAACLEAHLLHCTSCGSLNDQTALLLREIAADVPKYPDQEFWDRYRTSLEAKLQEAQPVRTWGFGWKAAAALVAAGLAVVVIRLGSVIPQQTEITTPSRQTEITDPRVVLSLIGDLNQLYGPDQEEEAVFGSSRDQALKSFVAQVSGYDSGIADWFEVEDEPENFLL